MLLLRCRVAVLAGAALAALSLLQLTNGLRGPVRSGSEVGSPPVHACIIAKDAADDLPEWLNYHRLLGVSRFLVYDDGIAPHSTRRPAFLDVPDVDVFPAGGVHGPVPFARSPQGDAYHRCIQLCPLNGWMAFFDVDEFPVLPGARPSLPAFLSQPRFDGRPAVYLNWVIFDGKDHQKRPAGGVLANYASCLPRTHPRSAAFKALVRCSAIRGMTTAHHPIIANGTSLPPANAAGEDAVHPSSREHPAFYFLSNPAHSAGSLYHYMWKSREEAERKLARTSVTAFKKDKAYYEKMLVDGNGTCGYLKRRTSCCPLRVRWDAGTGSQEEIGPP
ncbi:hypothetical protein DFJ74DRAFT_701255 [Hyaloraphidium curvatum]|nr:hypothetical protein DFJ74DRAFT_701255 [Hyaloraphidium curvatum]